MKKLLLILVLAVVAMAANAQQGYVRTLPVDTLKGNNNDTLGIVNLTGSYNSVLFEITCNKVSTAAGGTLYIKGGLSAPQVLNESNSYAKFSTNDTLTITDGLVWRVEIPYPADSKYFIYGDGDANDTVKVTTKYLIK